MRNESVSLLNRILFRASISRVLASNRFAYGRAIVLNQAGVTGPCARPTSLVSCSRTVSRPAYVFRTTSESAWICHVDRCQ